MPFEIGAAVNSAARWVTSGKIVGRALCNPLFVGLLIATMAALLVLGIVDRQKQWKQVVRRSFYLFLFVTAIMFVHNYAVRASCSAETGRADVRNIFGAIGGPSQPYPARPVVLGAGGDERHAVAAPAPEAGHTAGAPEAGHTAGGVAAAPDNVGDAGDDLGIAEVVLSAAPPRRR